MREPQKPTARQVYALAAALCEQAGEAFPETRDEASALIERLRLELGHPAPRLEDCGPRRRPRTAGGGRGTDRLASAIAAKLARELR